MLLWFQTLLQASGIELHLKYLLFRFTRYRRIELPGSACLHKRLAMCIFAVASEGTIACSKISFVTNHSAPFFICVYLKTLEYVYLQFLNKLWI